MTGPERNDPCPCGSGKKFKKCCGFGGARRPEHFHVPQQRTHGGNSNTLNVPQQLAIAVHYHRSGNLQLAGVIYQQILQAQPDHPEALNMLGLLARQTGQASVAVELIQKAIAIRPSAPEFHNNLAHAFSALDRLEHAIAHYERALELKPDYVEACNNLGNALKGLGRLQEAVACYERALAYQPDSAEVHNNLGGALKNIGRLEDALAHYKKAMDMKADYIEAHDNFLLTLLYLPDIDPATIYDEHVKYGRRHENPAGKILREFPNVPVPERRLKIGYVSSDFRQHSVSHFIEPVMECHRRDQFEVFCYSVHGHHDLVTKRLQSSADHWRDISGMDDELAVRQIENDRIDILVDLNGHAGANRLPVFARKPAPVQVTWLGYPATTGLTAIDYRITDRYADPAGATERFHSERLIRLSECFSCFRPPQNCPDVEGLPASKTGYVTFGSFNAFSKINRKVIAIWGEILRAVPGSRLTLKYNGMNDDLTRKRVREAFSAVGVSSRHLQLLGHDPSQVDHLRHYNAVDIGLDPFPYNGTTTTFDALWMGVPVITLAGDSHVSRVGVSQMSNLGLPELIAGSLADYVSIAVNLASDLDRLGRLRSGLRQRLAASPLTDSSRFTIHLEQAYRGMWAAWCEQQRQSGV